MVAFVRYDISCGDPCTVSLGWNGFRFATDAAVTDSAMIRP